MPAAPLDIAEYERVVVFTGAGVSAESGIPTYRGRGGIWTAYDWRAIACQEAFDADPEKVWDYHEWRRDRCGEAAPNAGHDAVAGLQGRQPGTRIITQNIDGLHQRAGAVDVIELHGSVWRVRCDGEGVVAEDLRRPLPSRRCEHCGRWLRPDIVWFGDSLDGAVLAAAVAAIERCDLFVGVGTSGVVQPAASLPLLAKQGGAVCVEVNTEETELTPLYDHVVREPASTGLLALFGDQPSR